MLRRLPVIVQIHVLVAVQIPVSYTHLIIIDGNVAYSLAGEIDFRVLTGQDIVSSQTGYCLLYTSKNGIVWKIPTKPSFPASACNQLLNFLEHFFRNDGFVGCLLYTSIAVPLVMDGKVGNHAFGNKKLPAVVPDKVLSLIHI